MSRDVVAIEYGGEDRPFSIYTRSACGYIEVWDAEWCARNETIYVHMSGGGGSVYFNALSEGARCKAWVAEGETITTTRRTGDDSWETAEIDRAELTAMGFDLLDAPLADPFADAEEGETIYCDRCEDFLPTENVGQPCDHIAWCDKEGWWVYAENGRHLGHDGSASSHDIDDECGE